MQLQFSDWTRALSDIADITTLDAPNPPAGPIPPDVVGFFGRHAPCYEWFDTIKVRLEGG